MIEKDFTINNKLGLHARPASLLVKTTARFVAKVNVIKGEHTVDGKSIMGLLMLAAGPGTLLKFQVEGPDEQDMIGAIEDVFNRKFDDEEKDF